MHKKITIKKIIHISALFFAFSNFSQNVQAEDSQNTQAQELNNNFAIGPKIGTTGFGLEGRAMITQNLYGRLGVNYFGYSFKSKDDSQVDYNVKLNLLTVPLMLDYHPFDNSGFRLSLGIAYNNNNISSNAKPGNKITLRNTDYYPDQVGEIKGKLTFGNKIVPVASIGYDSSIISNDPLSFNAEFGLMYSGKVRTSLSASGLLGSDKKMIDDLKNGLDENLNKIEKYLKIFPIISFGIKYSF
jgi:hypothetical protein